MDQNVQGNSLTHSRFGNHYKLTLCFLHNGVHFLCPPPSRILGYRQNSLNWLTKLFRVCHLTDLCGPIFTPGPLFVSISPLHHRAFLLRVFAHAVLWPGMLFPPPFVQLTVALPQFSA